VQDDGGTDWDADALADNATETSNTAISLDKKAACIIGLFVLEDTGAIDGVVTVYVLGDGAGVAYEETTIGSPYSFTFTPTASDTTYIQFSIDPRHYDNFKIAVKNESGQSLAVSIKYKTADIPVAS